MSDHTTPMPPPEVLARAAAFDRSDCHVSVAGHQLCIMRLALEMIASHSGQTGDTRARLARVRRIAEQALRECGT